MNSGREALVPYRLLKKSRVNQWLIKEEGESRDSSQQILDLQRTQKEELERVGGTVEALAWGETCADRKYFTGKLSHP